MSGDGASSAGIRVTTEDLGPDPQAPESVVIHDDYVIVCAGECYVDHISAYANGTHVLTVKGRKAK